MLVVQTLPCPAFNHMDVAIRRIDTGAASSKI